MKPKFAHRILAAAITSVLALSSSAFAENLTWDSTGATPLEPVNGPGTWNTTDTSWSNGSIDKIWNNATNDTAFFGGTGTILDAGTGIVTIATGAGITAGGLTFNLTGYTIAGDTLSFGGAASAITLAPATTTTISSKISGSSPIAISAVSGAPTLIFTNINSTAGLGNDYSTGTTINSGVTLQIGTGSGTIATGAYTTLGGGPITINSGGILKMWTGSAVGNSFTYANAVNLNGGTLNSQDGNYIFTGPIALTAGTTNFVRSQYSNKTVTLSGGVTGDSTTVLNLGNVGTGTTMINVAGTNSVGSAGVTGGLALTIGSGELNIAKNFFIGNRVAGGGVGNATLTQTGGTVTLSSNAGGFGAGLNIGYQGPSTTSYTLSGGKLNVLTGVVSVSQGGSTNATLAISGTGVANLKGLGLVGSASGTATINLTTGGRLNLGSGGITEFQAAGTKNINLSAGTVGAFASNWSSPLPMKLTSATTGVTIDTLDSADLTTPHTITLSGVLSGAVPGTPVTTNGKLNKVGAGTLVLSGVNTYTGDTTVSGGILAVNGSSIADANKLVIDGGTVDLTGTETVGSLYFATNVQATGTWGSSASVPTPTHIDNSRFSGTGVLQVGPPAGGGYSAWATANAGGGPFNGDFDNDGVSNGLEYFMGATGSSFTPNPPLVGGTVSYPRDPSATGVSFQIKTSPDLVTWTDVTGSADTSNPNFVKYTPPTGLGKVFVRLEVTQN